MAYLNSKSNSTNPFLHSEARSDQLGQQINRNLLETCRLLNNLFIVLHLQRKQTMQPVERIKMCLGFYFLLTANRNPLVRSWQFDNVMIESGKVHGVLGRSNSTAASFYGF